ncbi:hypothetical protein [Pseudomonas mosselii]|uniref:hypothetical protein n=1 Tax=Pseudomonas mosselii TaxID=78327 RepID=UPI0021DB09BD|nr:hypothetical protein [Pseudomonas mosselii]MCU9529347.1 hypothetical protein [Pseudomonas mosselii]MCU9536638.1 hypothetical protein [Pseudomonas mosselii]MCU9542258.1 hypothetical protein [Pseudomonas mosselii]MCU9548363.1 hypothetical protein [Pseudomonas mosselii]
MKNSTLQAPLFASTLLASLGVDDLSKIVSQTYDSQPQINKRSITYREQTTVFVDDVEAQLRFVVRLTVESKKRGAKRVPVENTFPSVTVSRLVGYDPEKNIWGTVSYTTEYPAEPSLNDAWETHLLLESIRSTMRKNGPYNWYPAV